MSLEIGRKDGEAVVFPTLGIRIQVRRKRGRTRLSIDAPRSVTVLREELLGVQFARRSRQSSVAAYRVLRVELDCGGVARGAISEVVTLATARLAVARLTERPGCVASVAAETPRLTELSRRVPEFSAIGAAAGDMSPPACVSSVSVLESVIAAITPQVQPWAS